MSQITPKAVVVENDSDLQFLYKLKLERSGFAVRVASDGLEGLTVIQDFQPDIILLDLLMPRMGGTEMLARLRREEWGSGTRVIVLTNISKTEAPTALRFLGVDRFLVKAHYTPAQVVEIARQIVWGETR